MSSVANEHIVLLVAQYFRGEAESDQATTESKRYYTGHLGDSFEGIPDENISETLNEQAHSTALHDAVMVGNQAAVEYFVKTGFNVTAKDDQGRTPYDLALQLSKKPRLAISYMLSPSSRREQIRAHTQVPVHQSTDRARNYERILNLLSQHPSYRFHRDSLPLGWQGLVLDNQTDLFRETSIDNDIDPITFKKPRSGLLQDERIAIAKRDVNGRSEIYWLNPIRFLRRPGHIPVRIIEHGGWNSDTITRDYPTSNLKPLRALKKHSSKSSLMQSRVWGAPLPPSEEDIDGARLSPFELAIERMQSSEKRVFDDSWYRAEIEWTRSLTAEVTEEGPAWLRWLMTVSYTSWIALTKPPLLDESGVIEYAVPGSGPISAGLTFYRSLTMGFINVLLVFIPLSIIGRFIGWSSNQQLAYSVLSIAVLVPNVAYHIENIFLKSTQVHTRRFLVSLASLIPDAVVSAVHYCFEEIEPVLHANNNKIGVSSILSGNLSFPLALMLGNAMTGNLLVSDPR